MCLNLLINERMRLPYNLKVIKMLRPRYGRVVLDDGRTISGIKRVGLMTPFQTEEVVFKDGVFEQKADPAMIKPGPSNHVYYGIHSLYTRFQWDNTFHPDLICRWAVIPAGTDIYVGDKYDVVSSRLLVFETYGDFLLYEEKHGTAKDLIINYKSFTEPYIKDATIVKD